jgi:hypothetical protein
MSDSDEFPKWASVVPEIYYDLIARVPAGTFLVLSLVFVFQKATPHLKTVAEMKWEDSLLLLFLTIAAGYSLSLIISPAGNWVNERFFGHLWRRCQDEYLSMLVQMQSSAQLECLADFDPKSRSDAQCRKMYRQIHDHLKNVSIQARTVLPKMQAEAALCTNFVVVGVIVLLSMAFLDWTVLWAHWQLTILSLVGIVCSYWASRYRTRQLIERHFSLLSMTIDRTAVQPSLGQHEPPPTTPTLQIPPHTFPAPPPQA